ncbi:MAG: hypothetical protein V2A72_06885, partial [Candidatus Omnitrophota bacterium]
MLRIARTMFTFFICFAFVMQGTSVGFVPMQDQPSADTLRAMCAFLGRIDIEKLIADPHVPKIIEDLVIKTQEEGDVSIPNLAINGGSGRIGTTILRAWARREFEGANITAINDIVFKLGDDATAL